MPIYKTSPNPFLNLAGGPAESSALDLMPTPFTAIPAAVLRGTASPAMRGAFEYMQGRYPRLMRLVKNVYATKDPKMTQRVGKELYGEKDKFGSTLAWRDLNTGNVWVEEPAGRTGLFPKEATNIEQAVHSLAHEAAHAWQGRRNPLMPVSYSRAPAPYENQAERWGSMAARRFRQGIEKAGGPMAARRFRRGIKKAGRIVH